jgi:hypothetical protein
MKFGIAIAARIPMITTTIISSIRVKPFWFFMVLGLLEGGWEGKPFKINMHPPYQRHGYC